MHRIDSRTVQLTPLERDIRQDADDWDEATDPQTWILDRAVVYGGVVSQEFVDYLAPLMRGGAVNGFAIGSRFAGSTITDVQVEGDHEVSLDLADGRVVVVQA